MKKSYLLLLFTLIITTAFGQTTEKDTSWKSGGFISINFSQTNLSQWTAGGETQMSLAGVANLYKNYLKGNIDWQNTLDLGYAVVRTESVGLRKSDDKIDFTSKYSKKFSKNWLYSGLVNFKSQFTNGFAYPDDSVIVSKFMAPAYLITSIGFTWKPVDYFEVMISPATAKFTFVLDQTLADLGAYGVAPGKTTHSEFGAYLNMRFKKDIMPNITFISRLELFNNYTDPDKDNRQNIDVNFENTLNMKVNKFITAMVYANVVYDANVIERTQFKEMIGVGFGYKFDKK
ncbi:MAG: DUF3078 domain-containing protein, partial [Bacteroidia bacterium]|nr:DUF3078 domain-containing protein [Bacteroidia bacterium]